MMSVSAVEVGEVVPWEKQFGRGLDLAVTELSLECVKENLWGRGVFSARLTRFVVCNFGERVNTDVPVIPRQKLKELAVPASPWVNECGG